MANKKTPLDDFNFDDLNFDDIGGSNKRDSKREIGAISKVATSFAGGARDAFVSPETIRRLASTALPKGYSTAINTAHDAYRGGAELYNIAASELRPALPAIRRATARVMPKAKSYLPKRIAEAMQRFVDAKDSAYHAPTQGEMDDSEIVSGMASIFKTQMEMTAESNAVETTERRIRNLVEDKQNRSTQMRLEAIRGGIDKLVAYQDHVTLKYQQKSLELQYRQYFTMRDMLRLQVENSARDKTYLDALVMNTSLSEQQKLTMGARAGGGFKDRLLQGFQQQISGYTGTFAKKLTENLKNSLRNTMSGLASGIMMSDDAAQMYQDSQASGMGGEDGLQMGGRVAGGMAADLFGRKIARGIRGKFDKNKNPNNTMGKVAGFGDSLSYLLGSVPERANKWAKTADDDMSVSGFFKRMIKEALPRFALDSKLGSSPILDADEPAVFNMQTRRSITEVIPGYLSRIHHELAIMRSGNSKLDRITYNMDRGEFTTFKKAVADTKKRIFNPMQVDYARDELNKFLQDLDKDNQLSPDARMALMRQILSDTAAGQPFDPKRYSEFEELTSELTGGNKEEVAKLFNKKFRNADGSINKREVNDARGRMSSLQNTVMDPKKAMGVISEAGGEELLQALGLITQKGFSNYVDYGAVFDIILGAKKKGGGGPSGSGASPSFPDAPTFGASMRDLGSSVTDIFVAGSQEPVMQAMMLRAGEYRDVATGKVLETVADIKGPVKNRAGEIVLTAQQMMSGLVNKAGVELPGLKERAKAFIKAAAAKASLMGGNVMNVVAPRYESFVSVVKDIYVRGSSQPALQAIKLQAGEYRDQITGQVITKLEEIKGPVVDLTGNVVLSAQDFVKGLRDKSGKSMSAIEENAKARIETLYNTHAKETAAVGIGPNSGPEAASVGLAAPEELVSLGIQQVELLKSIYEVLMTRNFVLAEGMTLAQGRKSWGRETLGKIGGLGKLGLKGLKTAGSAYLAYVRGLGSGAMALGKGALGLATGLGGAIISRLKSPLDGARDVYVKGEDSPALKARKMRLGHYLDVKSKKVVKNIKGITGPVHDTAENGEEVLSQEQFDLGIFVKGPNGFIRFGLAALGGLAKKVLGGYASLASLPFVAISAGVKMLKTGVGMLFNDQVDVYTTGDLAKPRLRAVLMRSERYYSTKSGKLIRGFKDIDGPVKELAVGSKKSAITDIEVLSQEDYDRGICNARGNPLRTGAQRVLGAAGALARGAGKFVGTIAKAYSTVIGGAFGLAGNLFGGGMKRFGRWFNPAGLGGGGDKQQLKVLEKIYALLDQRLVIPERIREGSWQDQLRDKATSAKDKAALAAAGKDGKNGGMMSMLASLFGGGGQDEEGEGEEGDDGDTTIIGGGGGGDGARDSKGRRKGGFRRNMGARWAKGKRWLGRSKLGRGIGAGWAGLKGLGGKIPFLKNMKWRGGGGKMGLAATILGSIGLGAAADKLGNSSAGKVVDTATTATTASWLSGMAGGPTISSLLGLGGGGAAAATAAGGTAGAAGTVAATGGAIIGAPVLIGAAAVAAIGYAAYRGFKKYKYGTYLPLRSFRMTQYGIPYSDAGQVEKIVDLEQMLEPLVKNGGKGLDIISDGKVGMPEIYKAFGLDDGWFSNNSDERAKFDLWFSGRFKSVFLRWMTDIQTIKPGTRLNDADESLTQPEKARLLTAAKGVPPGAYSVMVGPFDGDALEIGKDEIDDAALLASKTIDDEKSGVSTFKNKMEKLNSAVMSASPFGMMGGNWMLEKSQKFNTDRELAALKKDPAKMAALAAAGGTAVGVAAAVKGKPGPRGIGAITTLTSLQGVRYRAYGLTSMESDRVQALANLEAGVFEHLEADANGNVKFTGDANKLFEDYGAAFGKTADSWFGRRTWKGWFESRFLPVAIAFAGSVWKMSKNANPAMAEKSLSTEQLVQVAVDTMGAKHSSWGFSSSVWSYTDSPWDDTPLNNDSKTAYAALLVLKGAVKKQILSEPKADGAAAKVKQNAEKIDQMVAGKGAGGTFASKVSNWLSSTSSAISKTASGFYNNAKENVMDAASVANQSWQGVKQTVSGNYTGASSSFMGAGSTAGNAVVRNASLATGKQLAGLNTNALWQKVAPLIASGESMGGKYDAQNGVPGSVTPGLTSMTIGAVYELSKKIGNSDNRGGKFGPKTGAAGKYQFIPKTLLAAMKNAKLKLTDIFSPENQEKMGRSLFDMRVAMGMRSGPVGILDQLAMEWASLPSPSKGGRSWYHGDAAGNKAHGGQKRLEELMAAITGSASGGTSADFSDVSGGAATTTTANAGGGLGVAGRGPSIVPEAKAAPGAAAAGVKLPTYAAGPVPNINVSAGMPMAAPSGTDITDSAIVKQQRQVEQAAVVADYRGQAANADSAGQMSTMISILSESLKTQQAIAGGINRAVVALEGIKGSTIGATAGNKPVGSSDVASVTPARGKRPFEAAPSKPPVDVKRSGTSG